MRHQLEAHPKRERVGALGAQRGKGAESHGGVPNPRAGQSHRTGFVAWAKAYDPDDRDTKKQVTARTVCAKDLKCPKYQSAMAALGAGESLAQQKVQKVRQVEALENRTASVLF